MSFSLQLYHYDELPSTNDEARRLAQAGAVEGTAILADRQSAGRGRRGREWVSEEGNLFLSLILYPRRPLAEAASIGFIAQLALSDWLSRLLPNNHDIKHKWPNDILLNKKKISGILLESAGEGKVVDWLVLGIGVNLRHHPATALYPATDLWYEAKILIDQEEAAQDFIRLFGPLYDLWQEKGFAAFRVPWLERAIGLGEEIDVRLERQTLHGIFTDIGENGYLLVTMPDGSVQTIGAGDVFFKEASVHVACH